MSSSMVEELALSDFGDDMDENNPPQSGTDPSFTRPKILLNASMAPRPTTAGSSGDMECVQLEELRSPSRLPGTPEGADAVPVRQPFRDSADVSSRGGDEIPELDGSWREPVSSPGAAPPRRIVERPRFATDVGAAPGSPQVDKLDGEVDAGSSARRGWNVKSPRDAFFSASGGGAASSTAGSGGGGGEKEGCQVM